MPVVNIREARIDDETSWLTIRNDPEARFWSRVKKEITPAEHAAWFRGVLTDPSSVLRVAEEGGMVVGYARFEIDLVGTVSFGVAPAARRRGVGTELLRALDERAIEDQVTQQAWVHPSNIPSMSAFLRRGYVLGGEPGYQLLTKRF